MFPIFFRPTGSFSFLLFSEPESASSIFKTSWTVSPKFTVPNFLFLYCFPFTYIKGLMIIIQIWVIVTVIWAHCTRSDIMPNLNQKLFVWSTEWASYETLKNQIMNNQIYFYLITSLTVFLLFILFVTLRNWPIFL